jgi:hypothetical protein
VGPDARGDEDGYHRESAAVETMKGCARNCILPGGDGFA